MPNYTRLSLGERVAGGYALARDAELIAAMRQRSAELAMSSEVSVEFSEPSEVQE